MENFSHIYAFKDEAIRLTCIIFLSSTICQQPDSVQLTQTVTAFPLSNRTPTYVNFISGGFVARKTTEPSNQQTKEPSGVGPLCPPTAKMIKESIVGNGRYMLARLLFGLSLFPANNIVCVEG